MESGEKAVAVKEEQNYANRLERKVAVWYENAIILLEPSAILYFTVNKKKVTVHTRSHIYESGSSLEELEQRLCGSGFFRSHKSYVVNMNYVDRIVPWFNSTYMMKLNESTEQIPVGRHYVRRLMSLLGI